MTRKIQERCGAAARPGHAIRESFHRRRSLSAQRRAISDGLFRDPAKERQVSDYFECAAPVSVADSIIHFCRIAKESWNRPLVTGVFYGYFFVLFGRPQTAATLAVAARAGFALGRLSQRAYRLWQAVSRRQRSGRRAVCRNRCAFMASCCWMKWTRSPQASARRTSLPQVCWATVVATLRRNLAQAHTQGHGLWFYDFGPGRGSKGWWDDATLMKEIAAMRDLLGRYYEKPHVPQADVALVYDTDSFYYTAAYGDQDPVIGAATGGHVAGPCLSQRRGDRHLSSGRPGAREWGRYKQAVVFANIFLLTDAQKGVIRRKIARDEPASDLAHGARLYRRRAA